MIKHGIVLWNEAGHNKLIEDDPELIRAHEYLKTFPLINWCAKKRTKLENENPCEQVKGIYTAAQVGSPPQKEQMDPELTAVLKTMAL